MTHSRAAIILLVSCFCLSPSVSAQNWTVRTGVHDLYVQKEESHTRGVHAGFVWKPKTPSEWSLVASTDLLVDADKDELDPDHFPVWGMSEFYARKGIVGLGKNGSLNFLGEGLGRRNTASSFEFGVRLMSGVAAELDTKRFRGGVKVLAGLHYLELDDDVPKTRGYTRDDLRNATFAGSLGEPRGVSMWVVALRSTGRHRDGAVRAGGWKADSSSEQTSAPIP